MTTSLDFELLRRFHSLGLRNRLWNRLTCIQRAFYKASMWYTRTRGNLVNYKIVKMLTDIIWKLKTTGRDYTFVFGQYRAEEIRSVCMQKGVFSWCPRLRIWLNEGSYVTYQGLLCRYSSRTFSLFWRIPHMIDQLWPHPLIPSNGATANRNKSEWHNGTTSWHGNGKCRSSIHEFVIKPIHISFIPRCTKNLGTRYRLDLLLELSYPQPVNLTFDHEGESIWNSSTDTFQQSSPQKAWNGTAILLPKRPSLMLLRHLWR